MVLSVIACLSVRSSVTSRCSIKKAKHRISKKQVSSFTEFWWHHHQRGRLIQVGYVKIAFFDRSRSLWLRRLTAKNLCPSAMVVLMHGSALAEEYTVSSKFAGSWISTITVTFQLKSTSLVVWRSVDDTHGLRQHYMYVTQSITCSLCGSCGIKRGSCGKCSSGCHGISVCVIYTAIGQHLIWYRA